MSTFLDAATLIALVIAIYQLFRTGRVVNATRRVVGLASRQNAVYALLILSPVLEDVERRLAAHISLGDRDGTVEAIRAWRNAANDLAGLLRAGVIPEAQLESHVQRSLTAATTAKRRVLSGVELAEATDSLNRAVDVVCAATRASVSHIRAQGPEVVAQITILDDLKELYGVMKKRDPEMERKANRV
jgi:hypothetical protein